MKAGDSLAALRFSIDECIARNDFGGSWSALDDPISNNPEIEINEMRFTQLRMLSDGRVAAVWTGPFPNPEIFDVGWAGATPEKAIGIDGLVYAFVKTADGWRLDWTQGAGPYPLPLEWEPGTEVTVTN